MSDGLPVPDERFFQRLDMAHRYYFQNQTLAEVGVAYGVTREAVRLTLLKLPGEVLPPRMHQKERIRKKRNSRDLAELERRLMASPPKCVVCGCFVIRKGRGRDKALATQRATCSVGCSQAWKSAARGRLDENAHHEHRLAQARTILRRPEKYRPSQLVWGKAMLSDSPPPPNRRYALPYSHATAVIKKAGVSA